MTIHLVNVSTKDRITSAASASLRTHPTMSVHISRWMVLCLHAIMVADDEVTGRDPGIIGSASSAGAAHQVGHRLERAVLSPVGRAVMPTDGRRRSIRIRTVATINMTRIPPSSILLLLLHTAIRLLLLLLIIVGGLRVKLLRISLRMHKMMVLLRLVVLLLMHLMVHLMVLLLVVVVLVQILIIAIKTRVKRRIRYDILLRMVVLMVLLLLVDDGGGHRGSDGHHIAHARLHRVAQRAVPSF